jgi:hypothetical protein
VEAGHIRVVIGEREGKFVPARRHFRLDLRGIAHEPEAVESGTNPASWQFDPEERRLIVDVAETAASQSIDLSMR